MNAGRRTFLTLTLVAAAVMASRASAAEPPLKVLFVGNSYTFVNDLPAMLVSLADAAGGRRIDVDRHLMGGCTFERHVNETKAIPKIQQKRWDVVVLQEQSLRPVVERERMFQYAAVLKKEIDKQGAQTVLYLTWARQNVPEMQSGADPARSPNYARAMYQLSGVKSIDLDAWCKRQRAGLLGGLSGAYFDLARQLGTSVAPVGVAWQKALLADKNLVLHAADKSHPSPAGTYMATCVFYATLLGKSPVGLPAELKKDGKPLVSLSAEQARRLQTIAWQTVQQTKEAKLSSKKN
jgi:hypothetical protein